MGAEKFEQKASEGQYERLDALKATQNDKKIDEERACEANNVNKNLDSGYAWFILLVMFLLQSSISGASRVYGIVYAKEVAIGYYDREQASWPIASASAVENLAGILTPALVSRLSWRKIELLSASLLVLSNLLAYFSNSLWLDILALGLIQGLALSTCTVLSLVINNDYFERYRTTAYGIQMSGSTFGVLYLSPLVSWLLAKHEDNFRVVYLALALVFCGNVILVLFLKPRAKTIGQKSMESASSMVGDSKGGNSELDRVERALEYRENGDEKRKLSSNQPRQPTSRKLSRFESHFERNNSIASISYKARSRRQSILSQQQHIDYTPKPRLQQTLSNIYTIPNGGQSEMNKVIVKSKSGIELASSNLLAQNSGYIEFEPAGKQGSSLNLVCSSPLIETTPGHQLRREQADDYELARRQSKLSVTNSLASTNSNNHLRQQHNETSASEKTAHLEGTRPCCKESTCKFRHDDINIVSKLRDNDSHNGSTMDDVTDLERGIAERFNLSSSPTMLLQNKQQYLMDCAAADNHHQQQKEGSDPQRDNSFTLEGAVKLLKLPYLHCIWMMLALYYLIARVFVIILVDFADDHGFSLSESTNLLNYWSVGELVGRVVLGPLIDLKYISCKNCIVLTCTLLASCIGSMVLVESYALYAACSLCIAALISLEYMLINVLMVEYLGKEHVTNSYSLAACISSLVLFSRPSLIGFFRDHLGSYDGLLILLAALASAFALVFLALEPIFVRHWPKRRALNPS